MGDIVPVVNPGAAPRVVVPRNKDSNLLKAFDSYLVL